MSDRHVVYNQADYLSFEALEDGFMLSFPQELRYSVNGGIWKNLPYNVYTKPINSGDIISLQGDCEISTYDGIGIFNLNKKCNVFGNILSITGYKVLRSWQFCNLFKNCTIVDGGNLILPSTELANSCYESMFYGCTSLVNAPELPATTLSESCYNSMFYGCTSLVNAPKLPATTLDSSCYNYMFYGCTSLVNAPKLPATTLDSSCYNYMFSYCANLNYIKMLATDISAYGCLDSWVYGVSPTGTFVKSKDATWDVVGDSGVPTGWTVITDDQESGGGNSIFPMYLTTEQGSGDYRTRDADEKSLAILEYFNNNSITDSVGTKYLILDENQIFYIDEFLITQMYLTSNSISLIWKDMGLWFGYIREDGSIELFSDD